MKIKALLFDFDETLLENEKSARESVREAWKLAHEDYPNISPEQVVETYMDTRDKFWHAPDAQVIPIIRQGMIPFRHFLWRKTLHGLNIEREDLLTPLVNRFGEKRWETWRLYPDSLEILELLKKSYNLVMITNGVAEVQHRKIQKVNVESYFHPILISGEIGISKPDPQFFYQAADSVRVKYSECVVIGDSIRNDIRGAKNAGMTSVWVNRDGILLQSIIIPNYEIKTLYELPSILKTLE